jgi:hypothetical protein
VAARLGFAGANVFGALSAFYFDAVGKRVGTEFNFAVFRSASAVKSRVGLGRGLWSRRIETAGRSASVLLDSIQIVPLVGKIASHYKGASILQIMTFAVFLLFHVKLLVISIFL